MDFFLKKTKVTFQYEVRSLPENPTVVLILGPVSQKQQAEARALFHEIFSRGKSVAPVLRVTKETVEIENTGHVASQFRWDEIREVATFMRDYVGLAFRLANGWVEISEESDGWPALVKAMARRLPGIPADWYSEVVTAPAETSHRVLFKRVFDGNHGILP